MELLEEVNRERMNNRELRYRAEQETAQAKVEIKELREKLDMWTIMNRVDHNA
jgi:hypothetical protein